MKSFNKTKLFFSISLALIMVAGGAYIFFFVTIRDKSKSIAEFSARNEELIGRESRLNLAKNSIKMEQLNIDRLSTYFIKESEVVPFAKKIEALGPESGSTLSLELLEPGMLEGIIPVLNFRVKAKGGFKEVMKLIALLENYPIKFEWKSVHIARDDSATGTVLAQNAKNSRTTSPQWIIAVSLSAPNFLKE